MAEEEISSEGLDLAGEMPDVVVATVGAGKVDVTKYQGVRMREISKPSNQICREEFVALHSENILENLSDYLREKFEYSQAELEKLPEKKRDEAVNFNNLLKQFPKRGKFSVLVFPALE
ncbi:DNA-directed RNA polymerase mitochondrial [Taenia solium]|eukprot:TsM_001133900 transcript=TsM_001133900 gene=TsM_001133900